MAGGRVAAIGERAAIEGFGLAGVLVCAARTPDEVLAEWQALPHDVALVILTPAAARMVPPRPAGTLPLTAVMPG